MMIIYNITLITIVDYITLLTKVENMTTAINVFLKAAVREHGIPFELKPDIPNETTAHAIKKRKSFDLRHSSIDELKNELDL